MKMIDVSVNEYADVLQFEVEVEIVIELDGVFLIVELNVIEQLVAVVEIVFAFVFVPLPFGF